MCHQLLTKVTIARALCHPSCHPLFRPLCHPLLIKVYDHSRIGRDHELGETPSMLLCDLLEEVNADKYRSFRLPHDESVALEKGHGSIWFRWSWNPHGEEEYVSAKEDFDACYAALRSIKHSVAAAGIDVGSVRMPWSSQQAILREACFLASLLFASCFVASSFYPSSILRSSFLPPSGGA